MNLYLDTSALIKRYINEPGTEDVRAWIRAADIISTGLLTRAETAAGLTRLQRRGIITQEDYKTALEQFRLDWEWYQRIPINDELIARADFLACQHGLRGYDAVHLAAALIWQEALMLPVTLATYDQELANAGRMSGLKVLPEIN
jgi:predicted nucleic acid-binding protein